MTRFEQTVLNALKDAVASRGPAYPCDAQVVASEIWYAPSASQIGRVSAALGRLRAANLVQQSWEHPNAWEVFDPRRGSRSKAGAVCECETLRNAVEALEESNLVTLRENAALRDTVARMHPWGYVAASAVVGVMAGAAGYATISTMVG